MEEDGEVMLMCSNVWGQQTVSLVVALNNEMNRYRHLAEYAVQVSMNISILVTKMTEEVFMKSDELESQAMRVEEEVATKAQEVSTISITAADCVQNLMILRSIKEMKDRVKQSTKCLLDEANANALLETMLTSTLNHHRAHVIEGRRAMEVCSQADSAFWTKCFNVVSEELKDTETKTIAALKKNQKWTIQRRNRLKGKVRICESLSIKFVETLRRKLNDLERCADAEIRR
ncbi:hypothetical protein GE061_014415 [Apolygus lucorum]|uniref:Uncharacterized protein n=1 Tax=Apolygus lucorum TaxID=248454 RepID=A0A8S9XST9_APOLU|nr:hypothetical protein GE061_014415 [Apolygus lucorum]